MAAELDLAARIGRMQQADAEKRRQRERFDARVMVIESPSHVVHKALGPLAVAKDGLLDDRVWKAINRRFHSKYCSWWEKRVDGYDLELSTRMAYLQALLKADAQVVHVIKALQYVKQEFYCVPSPVDFAQFVVSGGWRKYQVGVRNPGVAVCRRY